MRYLLPLITFLLIGISAFSQYASEVSVCYGLTDSELLRKGNLDGAAGYHNNNSYEFGLSYLKNISEKFGVETGVNYLHSRVEITPAFTGTPVSSRFESLNLLSVPIHARYSLGKYVFISGGPLIDFQLSDESFDSQSGLGYSIGIGAKYCIGRISLYVQPNFKRHAVIPLNKERYQQKLTETGIRLGIGYQF